jgi:hypothetical protein
MRAADLKRAQTLVGQRDAAKAMADRIAAGERLHFILGEGSGASEIEVANSFASQVAADLGKALVLRAESLTADLREIGIDG